MNSETSKCADGLIWRGSVSGGWGGVGAATPISSYHKYNTIEKKAEEEGT
jgi:hypothetical protein